MKTITEHLRESLLQRLGFYSNTPPTLEKLRETEWDTEYERLRQNRMLFGYFRYGSIRRQNLNDYKFLNESRRRIRKYEMTGNLEHLLDAGNMLMIQYIKGKSKGQKVESVDDGEHNQRLSNT